jgi:hypothetical protein
MRLFALILTAGIALSSVSANAAVARVTSRLTNISTAPCPIMEGYPDCHPSGRGGWTIYSGETSRGRR